MAERSGAESMVSRPLVPAIDGVVEGREPVRVRRSGTTHTQRRSRRTPVTWVRGGGAMTLLFLLPTLLIFGAFSWYPIARTVIMSLQHTNLVQPASWVGLDNFRAVLNDPLLPVAVKNTLYFALLALL